MSNKEDLNHKIYLSNEIDIKELFRVLWQGKILIGAISFFFFFVTVIYSLSLPNIYQSKALLSPIDQQSDMGASLRGYSGLASLAGINLPTQTSNSNSLKALDKLQSLSFFSQNILPNIFLPDLMAVHYWDPQTNTIFYDNDHYDFKTNKWVRDFTFPQTQIPSAQESFEVFKEHISIYEDKDSGFISISVKHMSPYIAKDWTDLMIREVNYFFREKDKLEAQATASYLNTQISKTNFVEVKEAIAQLVQQKTQQLSLIEVSDFYVFEYIDPPVVMENKHEPKRLIMCIIGTFIGLIIGVISILFNYYFFRKNNN